MLHGSPTTQLFGSISMILLNVLPYSTIKMLIAGIEE